MEKELQEKLRMQEAEIEAAAVELERMSEELQDKEREVEEKQREVEERDEEISQRDEQLTKAMDALWGEMELAKKIQTALLPEKPEIKGYEITAYMEPTAEVGGDYYDVINVGDRSWLAIGDVSGHGVPAGLVMMMIQTTILYAVETNPYAKPSEIITSVNKSIAKNIHRMKELKYMTITLMSLEDNKFCYSGLHQHILIYRAKQKKVQVYQTQGMWIGLWPDIDGMLKDYDFEMEPGDTMLLYTDGITEAVSKSNGEQLYTSQRLVDLLKKNGSKATDEIKQEVIGSLKDYDYDDDITFMIIKKEN